MKTITLRQVRHNYGIYLLLLPAVIFIATFSYFPAASAMYHAFYRWNGDEISEWNGINHFIRAFSDETLAYAFGIVMVFIVANFIKMVPSIITAVVIHRMTSDKSRYLYRVLFVIPMVIPGIVWLLIWKFFYNGGVLNNILSATGGMWVLRQLDSGLPWMANQLAPVHTYFCDPVFCGVFGMLMAGVLVLSAQKGLRSIAGAWLWWAPLLVFAFFLYGGKVVVDAELAWHLRVPWYFVAIVGTVLAGAATRDVIAAKCGDRAAGKMTAVSKWVAIGLLVVAGFLVITTLMWPTTTGLFDKGNPPWLGHKKLAPAALIFWGFPWVGVVSVLLYLSGLGNIDNSVYEAADIDGCGWFRKFWNIELPLITSQVRLNLVLMIIGTLKGWGLVFILWGDGGGPGGSVMLPGLYMFRKAFTDLEAGYGCAIGLMLFVLILMLTLINNKYVRVEK